MDSIEVRVFCNPFAPRQQDVVYTDVPAVPEHHWALFSTPNCTRTVTTPSLDTAIDNKLQQSDPAHSNRPKSKHNPYSCLSDDVDNPHSATPDPETHTYIATTTIPHQDIYNAFDNDASAVTVATKNSGDSAARIFPPVGSNPHMGLNNLSKRKRRDTFVAIAADTMITGLVHKVH